MAKKKKPDPVCARNEQQKQLINALRQFALTFAVGPAGVGKTYIAAKVACELFDEKEIDRIIVTRPVVEAEEHLGYLPGTLEDKFAPYFAPIKDILREHFGAPAFDRMLKSGQIEIAPLAYMRGRTFNRAMVLLDEAQNTTIGQMKLFLTRLGEFTRACVSGDPSQKDIKTPSGLTDALRRVGNIDEVRTVGFSTEDVVRSTLVQKIVKSYEKPD